MRKARLIRFDLEILLDVIIDEFIGDVDYVLRNNNDDLILDDPKKYFISFIEGYLDHYKMITLENVPFVDRYIIRNMEDLKRFVDGDFVNWEWLNELAVRYLRDMGYSKKKLKRVLKIV